MGHNLHISLKALACTLAAAAIARAEFPLGNMGPRNLGIQYGLTFRGQDITNQDVPSHETIHAFTLGYAPIPYLGLEAGLGLDRFLVDRYKSTRFRGDYGISPLFGATAATPYLFEFARMAGGARFLYLNSEDGKGFSYSGSVFSPWLAAVLAPSGYFDVQAGARGHFLNGTMRAPSGSPQSFGNGESLRGFFSVTLKSPRESAFLTLDADCSPGIDSDWSNGPREASIGISFGTLLGWKSKSSDAKSPSPYFPAYREMKDKQDKMAEEVE
jgi:hypothetical protein